MLFFLNKGLLSLQDTVDADFESYLYHVLLFTYSSCLSRCLNDF